MCGLMRLPLLPCSQLNLHQLAVASASSRVSNHGDCTRTVFFFVLAVYLSLSRHFPRARSWATTGREVLAHCMTAGVWVAMTQCAGEGETRCWSVGYAAVLDHRPHRNCAAKKIEFQKKNDGFTPNRAALYCAVIGLYPFVCKTN